MPECLADDGGVCYHPSMGRNNNGPVRMKPKNPPPPRSQPCTCGGTLGIVCKCAGTGTSTDWIDDQDLEDIKNAPKHSK